MKQILKEICLCYFITSSKLIMGLMALTRFHSLIRIMLGIHMTMIVKSKSHKDIILITIITPLEFSS